MDPKREGYLLFKNLMDNVSDKIYFKDMESRFIMANSSLAAWHGCSTVEEIIGQTDFDTYVHDDANRMYQDEQRIIKSGEPLVGIEERETWKDGQIAWVSTTKMPLRDKEGEIIGTFGVSRDITKHKENELRAMFYAEEAHCIKEDMEKDVRMAAELQKSFFPRTYPLFPANVTPEQSAVDFHHHYHASGMVSGDLCTIRKLSETSCSILQCDVMGHGVRAALGTALICSMAEELAGQHLSPGDFLAQMNKQLMPILQQEDTFLYATASYAVFDAESGLLRFANAGHPVPLHFIAAEQSADWLMDDASLRGPALAICADAQFQTFEKQLAPQDSLIMYTDGLYEVPGPDGLDYGEERLLSAAQRFSGKPLQELVPALINESRHFACDGEFDDDVCLVGLTYKHRISSSEPTP